MPGIRVCLLLAVVLVLPDRVLAQQAMPQPPRCRTAIPDNIDAGVFTADMLALLRLSATFRAQCARIAAEPRVRLRLGIAAAVDGNGRAQTAFRRYRSGTIVAAVGVLFGENYRELLAHEFEHVLEQIEGVDLRREVAVGRAWEIDSGVFETRRALLAGVQVMRETGALHGHAALATPLR